LDAALPVFIEEQVRVLYEKPQADGPHFVLELKLHVELDRVTAKSDVVRRIGLVSEGQLEAKLLGVKRCGPLDVPRAKNRVSFFETLQVPKQVIAADGRARRDSSYHAAYGFLFIGSTGVATTTELARSPCSPILRACTQEVLCSRSGRHRRKTGRHIEHR
jgi:hypothetical protein